MQKLIGAHMVKSPYVAQSDMVLKEALDFMRECNIRHLPVTNGEKLVGLTSERDIREAMALPQAQRLTVGDIMKTNVYVARRSSPLRDVVRVMMEEKLGSAVVINDAMECIGIFTTIDALGVLLDLLDDEEDSASILRFDDYVDHWDIQASATF